MVSVPLPCLKRVVQGVAALRAVAFFEGHPAGFFLSCTASFLSYEGRPVPPPPEPARRLFDQGRRGHRVVPDGCAVLFWNDGLNACHLSLSVRMGQAVSSMPSDQDPDGHATLLRSKRWSVRVADLCLLPDHPDGRLVLLWIQAHRIQVRLHG